MAEIASRKIVLIHSSGSKANRAEPFPLENTVEIKLGRDPSNQVVYDGPKDDVVSRQHAIIRKSDTNSLAFTLEDLGSANGTFINGKKLQGKGEIAHGDVVTLGAGGPAFTFTLDPPPSAQFIKTKLIDVAPPPPPSPTRVVAAAEASGAGGESSSVTSSGVRTAAQAAVAATTQQPAKVGIGHETMVREIGKAKKSAGQQWMAVLAGVVVLALAGGGYLFWTLRQNDQAHKNELAQMAQKAASDSLQQEALVSQTAENMRKQIGMSAGDIVREYGPATGRLDVRWRLYDEETGRPVFLKMMENKGKKYPLVAQNSDGRIYPWLTLDDANQFNIPIKEDISGSAFVVSEDGFMLTNQHMAAAWRGEFFSGIIDKNDDTNAILVYKIVSGNKETIYSKPIDLRNDDYRSVYKWIPDQVSMLFSSESSPKIGVGVLPDPTQGSRHRFTGKNDMLSVTFANTRNPINGTLVRWSDDADVALIKVEASGLRKTAFADRDPEAGERAIVLGYPDVANKSYASSYTNDNHVSTQEIPVPFVTEGIVALVSTKPKSKDGVTTESQFGEVIQLTINSTGAGNSGGPVFDSSGKVMGIFAWTITSGRAASTGAVPIKQGMSLLTTQQ